jgi:S1-C subfamily serine protease
MQVPRLPDWLVYTTVLAALLLAAQGRRAREDAPPAPPPPPGLAQTPIAPGSPFAADRVYPVSASARLSGGTAFSVDERGLWLTAGRVAEDCGQVGVVVAEGRAVAARVAARQGGLAVLFTQGGVPALPLAVAQGLEPGGQVFEPGFPQGAVGEVAALSLGPWSLPRRGRGGGAEAVEALAENGRTQGLGGSLGGLSGAPVIDRAGVVVGVALGQSPRRGRLYAATPAAIRLILGLAHARAAPAAQAAPMAVDDYGRVADTLRRDLRVAQVVCLSA